MGGGNRTRFARAVLLASSIVTTGARANPAFPDKLHELAGTPCVPDCTLCHLTDAGGRGTVKMDSVGHHWMNEYMLDGNVESSVVTAFMGAASDMSDTDHDGIPDVTELTEGTDPGNPIPGARYACAAIRPVYGCVRVARGGPWDDVGALASACVILAGAAALRRARRGSRSDG